MVKESIVIRRKDALKEMALKMGIASDFKLNEFLSIVADTILDVDTVGSKYYGYGFDIVDDDYELHENEQPFDPKNYG